MATEKVNGVRVHFGPRSTETKAPSMPYKGGVEKEMVVPINYDDLPGVDADDALILAIPAGAHLVEATLRVDTAFTSTSGTTTINIGLSELDGTVIDADGIDATLAWDSSAGTVVACNGALIGAEIGSAAGQVTVTPSVSDLTAGVGRLIIKYVV